MELHGSLSENLQRAIESSSRLRGHPVYKDTLNFWRELVVQARHDRSRLPEPEAAEVERLIVMLENELADRDAR